MKEKVVWEMCVGRAPPPPHNTHTLSLTSLQLCQNTGHSQDQPVLSSSLGIMALPLPSLSGSGLATPKQGSPSLRSHPHLGKVALAGANSTQQSGGEMQQN